MACDCIPRIDEAYGELNAALKTVFAPPNPLTEEIDFDNPPPGSMRVSIEFEKADAANPYFNPEGKSGRKPIIIPQYCPFCGTRYVPEKESTP